MQYKYKFQKNHSQKTKRLIRKINKSTRLSFQALLLCRQSNKLMQEIQLDLENYFRLPGKPQNRN